MQETSQEEIKLISSKIKSAIDLARPFYEARKQSNELLKEKLVESANYEKAKTNLAAAKEMVHLAEQSAITVSHALLIELNLFNSILSSLEFKGFRRIGYSFTGNDFPRDKSCQFFYG